MDDEERIERMRESLEEEAEHAAEDNLWEMVDALDHGDDTCAS